MLFNVKIKNEKIFFLFLLLIKNWKFLIHNYEDAALLAAALGK